MIAFLERSLDSARIEVKSPDYIKGKNSGSMREIDASIRGKIGSAELLVIVECRDRQGIQDVTWIEQLPEKATDVGASKVLAEFSTGFSSGAQNMAASNNIDLRTYAEVHPNEILLWFGFTEIPITKRVFDIIHVTMYFDPQETAPSCSPPEVKTSLFPVFDIRAPIFRWKEEGTQICFVDIWNRLPNDSIYKDVPTDGSKIRKAATIRTPDSNPLQIMTTKGLQDVLFFHVEVDLWTDMEMSPLTAVTEYRNYKSVLAHTAGFEFRVGEKDFVLELHEYPGSGRQSVVLRGKSGSP